MFLVIPTIRGGIPGLTPAQLAAYVLTRPCERVVSYSVFDVFLMLSSVEEFKRSRKSRDDKNDDDSIASDSYLEFIGLIPRNKAKNKFNHINKNIDNNFDSKEIDECDNDIDDVEDGWNGKELYYSDLNKCNNYDSNKNSNRGYYKGYVGILTTWSPLLDGYLGNNYNSNICNAYLSSPDSTENGSNKTKYEKSSKCANNGNNDNKKNQFPSLYPSITSPSSPSSTNSFDTVLSLVKSSALCGDQSSDSNVVIVCDNNSMNGNNNITSWHRIVSICQPQYAVPLHQPPFSIAEIVSNALNNYNNCNDNKINQISSFIYDMMLKIMSFFMYGTDTYYRILKIENDEKNIFEDICNKMNNGKRDRDGNIIATNNENIEENSYKIKCKNYNKTFNINNYIKKARTAIARTVHWGDVSIQSLYNNNREKNNFNIKGTQIVPTINYLLAEICRFNFNNFNSRNRDNNNDNVSEKDNYQHCQSTLISTISSSPSDAMIFIDGTCCGGLLSAQSKYIGAGTEVIRHLTEMNNTFININNFNKMAKIFVAADNSLSSLLLSFANGATHVESGLYHYLSQSGLALVLQKTIIKTFDEITIKIKNNSFNPSLNFFSPCSVNLDNNKKTAADLIIDSINNYILDNNNNNKDKKNSDSSNKNNSVSSLIPQQRSILFPYYSSLTIDLNNHSRYLVDKLPLDADDNNNSDRNISNGGKYNCRCYTCSRHSRAYIHHLLSVHELNSYTLLIMHNLCQLVDLCRALRRLSRAAVEAVKRVHLDDNISNNQRINNNKIIIKDDNEDSDNYYLNLYKYIIRTVIELVLSLYSS